MSIEKVDKIDKNFLNKPARRAYRTFQKYVVDPDMKMTMLSAGLLDVNIACIIDSLADASDIRATYTSTNCGSLNNDVVSLMLRTV